MSTQSIYRMRFKNIEQKTVEVTLYDRLATTDNPYNIQYTIIDNGDTTQTVTFTWDVLPVDIDAVSLGYRTIGTLRWTDSGTSPTSPGTITIPVGDYDYRVRFTHLDDSVETYEFLAATIVDLVPAGDPLHIQVVDNNEDKFTQIKAKKAVISFLSDANNDMSIFADGPDDRWFVTIKIENQVIFFGFLTADDLSEAFLPPINVVTLVASDKLGALKDVTFTDDDGENPQGKYRIADILAMCLKKTKLNLPIRVINNLRHGTGQQTMDGEFFLTGNKLVPSNIDFFYLWQRFTVTGTTLNNLTFIVSEIDGTELTLINAVAQDEVFTCAVFTDTSSSSHIYDIVYLDARTFEEKIGESEDCSTVLEKILGESCFITQYKGEWVIINPDEFNNDLIYIANFTQDGLFVDIDAGTTLNKNIGYTEPLFFSDEETRVHPQREHGSVKETYRLNTWQELVCNLDFSRGDIIDDSDPLEITYEIECWTQRRGLPGLYNVPITITSFITRIFNSNDYEKERFISITPQTGHAGFNSTDDEYIESAAIEVQINDKFSGSIDWRFDSNIASSSANLRLFRFILIGSDGSGWILGEDSVGDGIPVWYDTSSWTLNSGKGATGITFGAQDETEWQNISWEVPPMPIDGNLYVWLGQAYNNAAVPSGTVISYSNLNLTYIPYINGSYRKYISQYNKVSRTDTGYLAKRDEEVFMSDSPKKIFKGAMFIFVNSTYELTDRFFTAASFGLGYPTSLDDCRSYGEHQAYSVWNQFRNANRVFDYTFERDRIINTGFGELPPDLINKFLITDISVHSNNRFFMLLHFDNDTFLCRSTGSLSEVFRTDIGKVFTEENEFKYESENV